MQSALCGFALYIVIRIQRREEMKSRSMLGLGLVSSLVCGTAATADLQGLDYRIVANNAVAGDTNWTVEIYAVLDEGSRLDAVAGDGKLDKRLAVAGGYFYQNSFGGNTSMAINPALYSAFPSLEYDSWVTIGAMDMTGAPYSANNLLDIGIDWTSFENGGDVYTDNGTWFVTPDDDQGDYMMFTNQNCEDKNGVLVARLTVMDPNDNASVFMGALFQGKDDAGNTWQETATIEFSYPTITDCNSNGVDDGCDIANGTSNDDNGNGVPDECEFTDCNENGVADEDDIADGTSDDCNGNGVPDECELVGGDCNENGILDECEKFADCNTNGIPDECEEFSDCNGNSIPDECEDLVDWDGNGVPDACEGLVAYNTTQDIGYSWIDDAILDSNDNDIIWVTAEHINSNLNVDYSGKAISIDVRLGATDGTSFYMHGGSNLNVNPESHLTDLRSGVSGTAMVSTEEHLHVDGMTTIYRDSSIEISSGGHAHLNDVSMRMDSELGTGGDFAADGAWVCADGSAIYANELTIDGTLIGTVDLYGKLENRGATTATDDILVTGDIINDGLISINRGVLYALSDITNNGTILGEVDSGPGLRGGDGPEAGDGLKVEGSYNAGAAASLFMPHENWSMTVGGNYNVAINDSLRFDMSEATLNLGGYVDQGATTCEVMSLDLGMTEDGLDQSMSGAFPVGNFNIKSGAIVELVDNHVNSFEGLSEVIYTERLVVEAGAELRTNGYIIYASEVDNQGTIIGEDDIVIIDPAVPGDANGDGIVGILDVLVVIADWGPCDGCAGDQNGDGQASILDVLFIIANWS